MPAAIPLVGAAFSIAGGVAAAGGMAAIAAGGLSALTLTSGLMIAGGALTGIGALTGNKKLMTLGSVLGLAGGVSNFLSKAGETAASTAGAEAAANIAKEEAAKAGAGQVANDVSQNIAAAAPTAVDTAASAASQAGTSALADAGSKLASEGGLISDAVKDFGAEQLGMAGPQGAGLADAARAAAQGPAPMAGMDPTAMAGLDQAAIDSANATQLGGTAAAIPGPMTSTRFDLQQGTYDGGYSGRGPESIPGQAQAPGDWWSKMKQFGSDTSKWIEKNPTTAKLGGGLVVGAMGYLGQNQLAEDQVKRQMAYQDWVRQRYSDSVRNLTIPSVVRTAPQTTGIIGGARG